MLSTTYPCSRCNGAGRLAGFSNVLGGTCFKCSGSGTQRHKPATPSPKWAVFGHRRDTNECVRLYNVNAKTEQSAIEKARATFAGASSRFRDEHSLDEARALRFEHLSSLSALTWKDATSKKVAT
jgi:hypothetical protein